MKYGLTLLTCITLSPSLCQAQEITTQPLCFTLRNEAPYMVYGDIKTDYYTTPDGIRAKHSSTFRLQKAGARHPDKNYPTDRAEFCSSGPFYSGRQLELTIRTLIPIFSCKTNIELGEIIIKGELKDDGTTRTWAGCY